MAMELVSDRALPASLIRRVARTHQPAPAARALLSRSSLTWESWQHRDRDCAAHMLHFLDDPAQVLTIGLSHLVREFNAARGDAGLADIADSQYHATVVVTHDDDPKADLVRSTALPNQHPAIRTAWAHSKPTPFRSVSGSLALGTLAPVFTELGATSMLASSIRYEGTGLGLLCLDEVDGERRWSDKTVQRLWLFLDQWFGPVLFLALDQQARSPLTPAENQAVQLLAHGLTYSQIARRLGKSERTIDNQLRSARAKTGTHNSVELVAAIRATAQTAAQPASL